MWVSENESARFWLGILNSLKNRGVDDILIACVDVLTGFLNAIQAVYPKTEIQQCIIYQIRNTTRFVSYKDIKVIMRDFEEIYAAVDEQSVLSAPNGIASIQRAQRSGGRNGRIAPPTSSISPRFRSLFTRLMPLKTSLGSSER